MAAQPQVTNADFPIAFQDLFRPAPVKCSWSGRGAAKSWSFGRAALLQAHNTKQRWLCAREFQNSIADSVHRLLRDQADAMGLLRWYDITDKAIRGRAKDSLFIFKGLHHNAQEIKSIEGIDRTWVEEAQLVSKESWEFLEPTVLRKPGSELWISFNPIEATDETYKRYVTSPPPGSILIPCSWRDNPWFTEELERLRRHAQLVDPDAYEHIWEGKPKVISDAVIFKGKYVVESFDEPTDPAPERFFYGADWGFANDPAVLLRSYITKSRITDSKTPGGSIEVEDLWITHEAYGVGIEIDDLPKFFDIVPGSRKWPIKADSSRPETISYVRGKGFDISPADKWEGCVEDGIAHLRSFRKIHIHERCKHTAEEARLYAYKVDRVTQEILPIVVDKHNHCWDSERYALDQYIQRRGMLGVWARL